MRNCKRLCLLMRNITSGPVSDHTHSWGSVLIAGSINCAACATWAEMLVRHEGCDILVGRRQGRIAGGVVL